MGKGSGARRAGVCDGGGGTEGSKLWGEKRDFGEVGRGPTTQDLERRCGQELASEATSQLCLFPHGLNGDENRNHRTGSGMRHHAEICAWHMVNSAEC